MNEASETQSIILRLRRTIHEDAFVAVPVTDAILQRGEDGARSVDFESFVSEAIRLSESESVDWQVEKSTVEPHPIQCPLPEGRHSFDAFYQNE